MLQIQNVCGFFFSYDLPLLLLLLYICKYLLVVKKGEGKVGVNLE